MRRRRRRGIWCTNGYLERGRGQMMRERGSAAEIDNPRETGTNPPNLHRVQMSSFANLLHLLPSAKSPVIRVYC